MLLLKRPDSVGRKRRPTVCSLHLRKSLRSPSEPDVDGSFGNSSDAGSDTVVAFALFAGSFPFSLVAEGLDGSVSGSSL